LPREVSLRAIGPFVEYGPRKVSMPLKTPNLRKVLPKSKRLKAMETRI